MSEFLPYANIAVRSLSNAFLTKASEEAGTKAGGAMYDRLINLLSPQEREQAKQLLELMDDSDVEGRLTDLLIARAKRDHFFAQGVREAVLAANPMVGHRIVDRESWERIPLPVHANIAQILSQYGDPNVCAVDDSVLLLEFQDHEAESESIAVSLSSPLPSQQELRNPKRRDLVRAIEQGGLEETAEEYLKGHIDGYLRDQRRSVGPDRVHYTKIGVRYLQFPNSGMGTSLALHIAPLSQWIEQEFHRRILTDLGVDEWLSHIYDERLRDVLRIRRGDTSPILAPSTLFVEVGTVTSDGRLVLGEKDVSGSTYAMIGRPRSCPIERSVRWGLFNGRDSVDLRAGLQDGAKAELSVTPSDISEIRWSGIAVEGNLNIAVLGLMTLGMTARELEENIAKSRSRDFRKVLKMVDLEDVPDEVFSRAHDRKWHTTARMRILLILVRLKGIDWTRDELKRVRSQ
jgi:hypothetical protein